MDDLGMQRGDKNIWIKTVEAIVFHLKPVRR